MLESPVATTPSGFSRILRELSAFLSLEAPFLLQEPLPEAGALEELEAVVRARVDRSLVAEGPYREVEIHPALRQGEARAQFRDELLEKLAGFFERQHIKLSISADEQVQMLEQMLVTRALDDFLKNAFDRKTIHWDGHASPQKGFRSRGQEAVVGATLRLRRSPEYGEGETYRGDFISPIIRDLGALLSFMPEIEAPILTQYGKKGTLVDGRDLHLGDLGRGVLHSAAPLAIAAQTLVGISYGCKLRGEDRVCVTFIGEGGSSLGEWQEALNFAAVQQLNMVFVLENNHWALGTHVSEQSAVRRFAHKAGGVGIPGITLFGNDPDEVAAGVTWAAERARAGNGPALIELVTYRRGGHAHHDDDRYHGRPDLGLSGYEYSAEREAWLEADPIDLYEARLLSRSVVSLAQLHEMKHEAKRTVDEAAQRAESAAWPEPSDYRDRIYAERVDPVPSAAAEREVKRATYDEAVRLAIAEMMREDERVFLLGEDVGGRYGGAFGVTRGLAKEFGNSRCLNTPISESAIVGCGVGAALTGFRPIVEMQFADFLATAFNALVNNAAKNYWRFGQPVPLVVRLPYGCATGRSETLLGGGPFHSQCPEMWFLRTPGWKIVAPASPEDAKGLMTAAIRDPNPVLFLEAKGLYGFFRRDLRREVPVGTDFEVPIGKAAVRREGGALTLLTYGAMVWTALDAAEQLATEGLEVEVVDLRTLWPLDRETIEASIRKTHRVLILHEDTRRGGLAGELTAQITENLFFELDAPIRRVTAPDTPVPYSPPLEYDYLPKVEDVVREARELAAL